MTAPVNAPVTVKRNRNLIIILGCLVTVVVGVLAFQVLSKKSPDADAIPASVPQATVGQTVGGVDFLPRTPLFGTSVGVVTLHSATWQGDALVLDVEVTATVDRVSVAEVYFSGKRGGATYDTFHADAVEPVFTPMDTLPAGQSTRGLVTLGPKGDPGSGPTVVTMTGLDMVTPVIQWSVPA